VHRGPSSIPLVDPAFDARPVRALSFPSTLIQFCGTRLLSLLKLQPSQLRDSTGARHD